MAALGAVWWAWATHALYDDWNGNFDVTWMSWVGSAVLMGVGFDLVWMRRTRDRGQPIASWEVGILAGCLLLAALYRLGNIAESPGPSGITQIEDLQSGAYGATYLAGSRVRWEFIGQTWLSALGLSVVEPTLFGMRVPFAVVSALKVIPLYLWLRSAVGVLGASAASLCLAVSSWDVIVSRIPANHDVLVIAIGFALLAGPVRRGRPSAFVALGFLGGYSLYEYIAYRPFAAVALAGAFLLSWRDEGAPRSVRIGRPVITTIMVVCMVFPLFANRLQGKFAVEYLDGVRRAQASSAHAEKRLQERASAYLDRSERAMSLFFFQGERHPTRSVDGRPLLERVPGFLFLVGMGVCLATACRALEALTLLAFGVTLCGTMVLTGDFNVIRISSGVAYVYVFVGYGAQLLYDRLRCAWGRFGGWLALAALSVALLLSTVANTKHLFAYWSDPRVQRAQRSSLVYLTSWLNRETADAERVLGIAPNYQHVLGGHDAAWLRDSDVEGVVCSDVASALDVWRPHEGPSLIFVFAEEGTKAAAEYLEWLFDGLEMELIRDPLGRTVDVAYAHLSGAPDGWEGWRSRYECWGGQAAYSLFDGDESVVYEAARPVPLLDRTTWPQALRDAAQRTHPRTGRIEVEVEATVLLPGEGTYSFKVRTDAGRAELSVDGQHVHGRVRLERGPHRFSIRGQFLPLAAEPTLRLYWIPPGAEDEEIMPLYRLSDRDPACRSRG